MLCPWLSFILLRTGSAIFDLTGWFKRMLLWCLRFGEHRSNIRLNHPVKSNIALHVLSKINDNQGHSISLDNLKVVKEIRKQNELDAYESYYISRRKREDANLMNVAAGKITSRLFDLVP
jgi:hypothetical protein